MSGLLLWLGNKDYSAHPCASPCGRAAARSKSFLTILSNEGSHPEPTPIIKKASQGGLFYYMAGEQGFEP